MDNISSDPFHWENSRLNPARKQLWKVWIPALLWLGLIALESSDLLSSTNESRILYPLLTFLFGHIDPLKFMVWNHYLRKAGHVAGYFVLSWLLFRAWRATLPLGHASRWSLHWARISFFMSALVAGLDEWHQSYLPSRTGSLRDVLLDCSAALAAQLLLWGFLRSRAPAEQEIAAFNSRS